jgi:ABC-2 type transport system permease protein
VQGSGANMQILPMGYDRFAKREYGNRNFMLNSILYLADDDGWLQLRSREFKLRMLNKKAVIIDKKYWQFMNVAMPIAVLLIFALIYSMIRRKLYTREVKNL